MNAYGIFEFIVIALIVGASANRVIRQYAPAFHRRVLAWCAARLGIKLALPASAGEGCSSGCGTCATGCSTGTAPVANQLPSEQPLQFRPQKR